MNSFETRETETTRKAGKNTSFDASHQGQLFDTDAEPFSWLLALQLVAGWTVAFCVVGLLVSPWIGEIEKALR